MQLGGRGATTNVGRYRIQAVAAMTGVSAATLRAWERRYQIPQPQRTASAYRLYTDADVDQVRRMRELCAAGHSAAQAAALVRQRIDVDGSGVVQDPLVTLRELLLDATQRYDESALQDAMRQLLTIGPAGMVFEQVLAPVMVQVGELWRRGELCVAQEHLLSQQVETSVRQLLQLVQPLDPNRLVLLACTAEETHTLGLYGVGLRFAGWGYRVVHLGARLPPQALGEAVAHLRPDVVGLSSITETHSDPEICAAYAQAVGKAAWVVGGPSAQALAGPVRQHGGLVAADSLDDVRHQIEAARRPLLLP